MESRKAQGDLAVAAKAALPVVLGYVTIGLPCGVMASQAGLAWWQALLVSATFYSGAGQFMMASMVMAGSPLASIIASVGLVSSRQLLYAAALAPYVAEVSRPAAALFAAGVTDESFGVNLDRFQAGEWSVRRASLVNLVCMLSWAAANAVGCAAGEVVDVPTDVMSFGMTAIFICLLAGQSWNKAAFLVAGVAACGVVAAKLLGLGGVAVFVGAVVGVAAGVASGAFGKAGDAA